jgi:TolA-binding protein
MSVIRRRAWICLGGSLCLAVTLGSCGTLPLTSADKKSDRPVVDSGVVQSLQRQIKEREKRIAELESQLDALKMIDQDMEKRRQSNRPPATLTPIE